jgi:hypothetical protein
MRMCGWVGVNIMLLFLGNIYANQISIYAHVGFLANVHEFAENRGQHILLHHVDAIVDITSHGELL